MSSNTGGVQQSVTNGSNTGAMQAGVAGGNANVVQGDSNIIQQTNQVEPAEQPISEDEAFELLAEIEAILQTAHLSDEQKRKVSTYLAAAKEAAQEDKPDKDYIKGNLEKVTKTIQATTETVMASQGLWDKLKPIFTKLAPWLGVAASYFVGGF
jgi:ribosomal protein L16 Arg81 hydroxylase